MSDVCVDGSFWVIEAKIKDKYHGTGVHLCGADNVFVPAGLALIKLVGHDIGQVGN